MRRPNAVFVAVLVALLALLGACGSSGGETPDDENAPTTSTSVAETAEDTAAGNDAAEIAIAATAGIPAQFIAYGIDEGYFTEENLSASLELAAGGAAIVPGLMSGEYQFGAGNSFSMILARHQGLDLQVITGGTVAGEDPMNDFTALIVHRDSDIETVQDLEGATIAIATLHSVPEMTTKYLLEQNDVDPDAVEYLELPFPEMLPAMDRGEIDAAWILEPFRTLALNDGHRLLTSAAVETYPGLAIGTTAASTEYINANPEVVQSFYNAIARTTDSVNSDPDAFRTYLVEKEAIPAPFADDMVMPIFATDVDEPSLELMAELMFRYGTVDEHPTLEGLVWRP